MSHPDKIILDAHVRYGHNGIMKLNEYMSANGLKPEAVAAAIGVSLRTAYRYMNGERIPNRPEMQKLVEFTGGQVTANDFYLINQPPSQ